ncbi:MAG TPA: type II toxin-antitoxin system VapC family toxin [Campylobacterales bacterium]|nr:type II toxin-antitoxin system VapC family toxin [Campylobacterales bacterium]
MSIYILDTDIVSYLWDRKSLFHNKVVEHLNRLNDDDIVGISVVTIYELTYGMDSFKDEKLKSIFKNALESLQNDKDANIFALNAEGATFFSQLKLLYKNRTGITLKDAKKNDLDLVIASIAMSKEAILVSNDGIFKKLSEIEPKFKYESWLR